LLDAILVSLEGRRWKFMTKLADFTLQDDQDKTVHLKDFAGKPVILFFYPRADTPGCTIEACGFRDQFTSYRRPEPWCSVFRSDTVKAQKKFKENTISSTRSG